MKGPKDSNNEEFLDLKMPDFLESVFVDIARNLFGMAYLNMVNPEDIQQEKTGQNYTLKASGFNPRDAIESKSSVNSAAQCFIPQSLVPGSNIQAESSLNPKPRDELINPSPEVSRHASEVFTFDTEPTSLFDIFLRQGSPFSIFRDTTVFESSKNDKDSLFKSFENGVLSTHGKPTLTFWSSSVSIFTSADGVTTTRKMIRRADGTEEITETITPPPGVSSKCEEQNNFASKPSLIRSSGFSDLFGALSEFWHNIFT